MGKIKPLKQDVYEKIAAGEVIERPASVVKELVENSIDAGSSQITVETIEGGKKRINVSDNGEGFLPEDIETAFHRHSTSKLFELSDFDNLQTLGFRGEALPSILAVAKINLSTSTNASGMGIHCYFENQKIQRQQSIAFKKGTTIEVLDLFYNFPVRKKFLKADRTEFKQISVFLEQMALAHPQISFSFYNNNKTIFIYSGVDGLKDRIYQVFGKEFLDSLIEVNHDQGMYQLHGYISKINYGGPTKKQQFFIVNGRIVREKTLISAFNNSFGNFLEKTRHPQGILLLEIPADEIDVNIHPMKLEIKFINSSAIYGFINQAIFQSLSGKSAGEPVYIPNRQTFQREDKPWLKEFTPAGEPLVQGEFLDFYDNTSKGFLILGQFNNSYIVVEKENQLLIIDQHNAQERINFDRLKTQYEAQSIETITPLFPIILELSVAEMTSLDPKKVSFFKSLGFDITILSGTSIDIKHYPHLMVEHAIADVIKTIIHDYQNPLNYMDKVLATIACKNAIKSGQHLHLREMQVLIEDLFQCENPYFCPHQRPILMTLSTVDIEKKLKRK